MLSAVRSIATGTFATFSSASCITRSFATQMSEQKQRINEYNRQRKQYREQVSKLRKQYAEESRNIQLQIDAHRAEKIKANQEKMQVISTRIRNQAKDNARFHYEHLCNQEIMKSIRQTRGVMHQMRLKRERNENLRKMLLAHMPYVYNCYKLEEVETRVLAEIQEIVPFDRVFMAPPSGIVKDSDYLSFKDYETITGISIDHSAVNKRNRELYQKWKEEKSKSTAEEEKEN